MTDLDAPKMSKYLALLANKRGNDFLVHLAKILDEFDQRHDELVSKLSRLRYYYSSLERMEFMREFLREDDAYFPEALGVRADDLAINCAGFYPLEYASDGSCFRWTGPENISIIEVTVNRRKPLLVQFTLTSFISFDEQAPIRLFIDGEPIETHIEKMNGLVLVTGTAPARTAEFILPTEIALALRTTIMSPGDDRKLGVGFSRLQVDTLLNVKREEGLAIGPVIEPELDKPSRPETITTSESLEVMSTVPPTPTPTPTPREDVQTGASKAKRAGTLEIVTAEPDRTSEEFLRDDCANFPETLSIQADDLAINCAGFYPLEYASDGSCFRWTGPENISIIEVTVNRRKPLLVQFTLTSFISFDEQAPIRLFIDGEPIETHIEKMNGLVLVTGTAPARTAEFILPTEIALALRTTIMSPGDDRKLGVGFSRLQVDTLLNVKREEGLAIGPVIEPELDKPSRPETITTSESLEVMSADPPPLKAIEPTSEKPNGPKVAESNAPEPAKSIGEAVTAPALSLGDKR